MWIYAIVMGSILLLCFALEGAGAGAEKIWNVRRLRRDNRELLAENRELLERSRGLERKMQRLESRLSGKRYWLQSGAEERELAMERELETLRRELRVKDAMLRALNGKLRPDLPGRGAPAGAAIGDWNK